MVGPVDTFGTAWTSVGRSTLAELHTSYTAEKTNSRELLRAFWVLLEIVQTNINLLHTSRLERDLVPCVPVYALTFYYILGVIYHPQKATVTSHT